MIGDADGRCQNQPVWLVHQAVRLWLVVGSPYALMWSMRINFSIFESVTMELGVVLRAWSHVINIDPRKPLLQDFWNKVKSCVLIILILGECSPPLKYFDPFKYSTFRGGEFPLLCKGTDYQCLTTFDQKTSLLHLVSCETLRAVRYQFGPSLTARCTHACELWINLAWSLVIQAYRLTIFIHGSRTSWECWDDSLNTTMLSIV